LDVPANGLGNDPAACPAADRQQTLAELAVNSRILVDPRRTPKQNRTPKRKATFTVESTSSRTPTSTHGRAKAIVKAAFARSPISRLKAKEMDMKARLSRTRTTWWDAAAVGIADGTVAIDRALNRTSCHTSTSLMTLAKGRIHGQQDMAHIDDWRDAAVDKFLGVSPEPCRQATDATTRAPRSPDHYTRKYGPRHSLPPLKPGAHLQRKLRLNELAVAARQREMRTLDMRATVFAAGPV